MLDSAKLDPAKSAAQALSRDILTSHFSVTNISYSVIAAIDKLIDRFKQRPADFSRDELARLLRHFGYAEQRGKDSRRKFKCEGRPTISLHEPHPGKIVKQYAVRDVSELLENEGLL